MKGVLCLLFLTLAVVLADIYDECDMAGFYKELGCSVDQVAEKASNCPDSFKCPDLHPNPKQCFYRGVAYNDREIIPQNLVNNPCSQVCRCQVRETASFQCAAVDCVETFDNDMVQCIYTYNLDSCCYVGSVCGKDATANLKVCEVNGEIFKEGQVFYPKNTRKTCLCTAAWNGTIDDVSYCRDINCGVEIHYQDKLMAKCAPIFLTNDIRTCPIGFQCPTNTTSVVRGLNVRNVKTQCVFGNMTVSVGDEITVDEKCVKCTCEVPPFVTCTRQTACDSN